MSERFSAEDLKEFEARLQKEIENGYESLKRPTSEAKPVSLDEPIGRLSRIDALQRQHLAQASRANVEASIAKARSALARIRSDEFGICRLCGEEIEEQRLRSYPSSALCLACQSKRE